jgi:succinoglycan biosynthesis protein ExoA
VNASTFPLKQSGAATATAGNVLIVIPTLNEADHIGRLVDWLSGQLDRLQARLVVVDGGSSDQTCKIVQDRSSDRVKLIQNPHRLQSAALNLAVAQCADERTTWLIRVDAHAHYPDDFCDILLDEAQRRGADSVVVSMEAVGSGFWQRAIALAQNSRFGNGGSAHRLSGAGKWVDHGHHALMRIDTFKDVGGYDPSFSHNEDAELDLRLAKAGHRIWLTGRTRLQYIPRSTPGSLARQYFRFGRGRARTILKHRQRPRLRQAVLIALGPMLALVVLAPLHPVFVVPFLMWILGCSAVGLLLGWSSRDFRGVLAGYLAGIMQAAWSLGFWREVLGRLSRRTST